MASASQTRSYQSWTAVVAAPNDFNLDAGEYGLTLRATVWGTATLQRVLPDGAGGFIYVTLLAAIVADGYSVIELPAGRYRMLLAGVTALSGAIEQIAPGRMGG